MAGGQAHGQVRADLPGVAPPASIVRSEGFEPSRPRGHTDLNRARMPFRHERLFFRAATGIRTRDPYLGKVVLSTPELQPHEPFPGADPGGASLPRTRGRRSEGRELGKRDSNTH